MGMNLQIMIESLFKNTSTYILTLSGRIPSKKNGKIMIFRGGKPLLISTPQYSAWRTNQLWEVKRLRLMDKLKIPEKLEGLRLDFFMPDKRRTDLTNKAESVMDLLVDSNVIEDDNCSIVPLLVLRYCGVDRINPRVEIHFI